MNFQKKSLHQPKESIQQKGEKQPSRLLVWGFVLVLLLAGLVFGLIEYRFQRLQTLPNTGEPQLQLFAIETGSTVKTISANLEAENFVLSAWAFEKYAKRKGIAENFQAGRFYLPQNLPLTDIAAKLLNAKKREEFFTIPEGLTLEQIDARIAEKGYAPAGAFLECVRETCIFSNADFLPEDRAAWEGYFFPDTYAVFPENFSVELLATTMLATFEKRAETIGILDNDNLNDIVIMASMIEKESREDAERPVVSGILWKRLEQGWVLGVDATVRYFTGKQTEPLTIQDLETDNPYNTRKNLGLPPTAICNPGFASLEAAADPEESEYWFYLHGEDGQIYYAVTNEEHNRNKARYL